MGVRPTRKAVQRAAASMSAQRQAEMVVDNDGESYQSNQESFEEVPSNQTVSPQGGKRESIKPKTSVGTNSENTTIINKQQRSAEADAQPTAEAV